MPAFLVKFGLWLGEIIFERVLAGILAWARAKKAEFDAKNAIEKAALDSLKKLKDAKSGKDVDDATDDALGGV